MGNTQGGVSSELQPVQDALRGVQQQLDSLGRQQAPAALARLAEAVDHLQAAVRGCPLYARVPLLFYQGGAASAQTLPSPTTLQAFGVHTQAVTMEQLRSSNSSTHSSSSRGRARPLLYVVHHTARFESTNLDRAVLASVRSAHPGTPRFTMGG